MEYQREKNADEVFCRSCGEIIKSEAEICPKCGVRQKETVIYTTAMKKPVDPNASKKSRLIAFLLSFFLGTLGAHRFYVGKTGTAILQILFGWATLFIWNLVDMIMILAGTFKDIDGKEITNWEVD